MAIEAKDAVVWTMEEYGQPLLEMERMSDGVAKQRHVAVLPRDRNFSMHEDSRGYWCDPIGANYAAWKKMTNQQRAQLLLETALDLIMQGWDPKQVIGEFAKIDCFYDLGRKSYPMCRALTLALLGTCLEPNTTDFDGLMSGTYGEPIYPTDGAPGRV